VDAALFSREMGPAYNFCTCGDALVKNDLEMLRAYLSRHGAGPINQKTKSGLPSGRKWSAFAEI